MKKKKMKKNTSSLFLWGLFCRRLFFSFFVSLALSLIFYCLTNGFAKNKIRFNYLFALKFNKLTQTCVYLFSCLHIKIIFCLNVTSGHVIYCILFLIVKFIYFPNIRNWRVIGDIKKCINLK